MKNFKISYNVLKDTMNGYNIHDIFTWLMIDYFSQEKYFWFFTLQGAPGYNLGDLNLWCQRVCHLMIRRECLKKVLLCNMLRFPTIQFVHMQTFATTSCQIQNDALQFFINSVDWRLHSDNFKFSYICAHLHINKKWKIDKMIHGRQL